MAPVELWEAALQNVSDAEKSEMASANATTKEQPQDAEAVHKAQLDATLDAVKALQQLSSPGIQKVLAAYGKAATTIAISYRHGDESLSFFDALCFQR